MDDNQLYIEQMKEWAREMDIRAKEFVDAMHTSDLVKESNMKQLELHKQRTNLAIDDYNKWAKENNGPEIELV